MSTSDHSHPEWIEPGETTSVSSAVVPDGSVAVVLPAAGSGRRFGDVQNKLFAPLDGMPLWLHSARRLLRLSSVGLMVVAVSEADEPTFRLQAADHFGAADVRFVRGGCERTDSVAAALASIADDGSISLVAVHDAARPLVRSDEVADVIREAATTGAAILAHPVVGTVKRGSDANGLGPIKATVDRRGLYVALTPQVFRREVLVDAYGRHRGRPATDDAELVERCGVAVGLVKGSAMNLKITYPEDLLIAESILRQHSID
ncbi:MAG: 2-C-methyl-D-erythritol 4-phosphate cytidylyltransferase [Planctomycetota bacterium]